jgi:TonB family protein
VVVETDDPTTEDLALLLEATPLDLSRLSAVRPQIVLPGTSAWILIRNPAEVDRFMTGVAYGVDSQLEGLVDVAVWIDEWGSVEWAEISRSSGRQEMDEVALALFTKVASFRPARDRGVRVSLSAIFSVPFPW